MFLLLPVLTLLLLSSVTTTIATDDIDTDTGSSIDSNGAASTSILHKYHPAQPVFSSKGKHPHQLGDSSTTIQSEADFFSDIDINGNGKISEDELYEFVQETGGDSLDEKKEVLNAVDTVLSVLDGNNDKVLKKDDLSKYMKSLASLLSLEEVANWVAHAQQMPQEVVQSFIENSITGYDFTELLQNDGRSLEKDLNILRPPLKRRLMRGMRMKLLGMGSPPLPPHLLSIASSADTAAAARGPGRTGPACEAPTILIQWGSGSNKAAPDFLKDSELDFPVHKYQLFRQRLQMQIMSEQQPDSVPSPGKFALIYEGMEMFFKDHPPLVHANTDFVKYTYRLLAWNVIGRSEYSVFEYSVQQLDPRCFHDTFTPAGALLGRLAASGSDAALMPPAPRTHAGLDNPHAESSREEAQEEVISNLWNKIVPFTSQSKNNIFTSSVNVSDSSGSAGLASQLFDALCQLYSFSSFAFYVTNHLLKLFFILLSMEVAMKQVRATSLYQHAIDCAGKKSEETEGVTEATSRYDKFVVTFASYASFLEPVFAHARQFVLIPVLRSTLPYANSLVEALAVALPSCKSTMNYFSLALQYLFKLVLDQQEDCEDSAELTARSEKITSNFPQSEVEDEGVTHINAADCDGSGHCSFCFTKVTANIFKFTKKMKRHHCGKCFKIFCKACGSVDHNDFMSCKVPGNCFCKRCLEDSGQSGGRNQALGGARKHRRSNSSDKMLPPQDSAGGEKSLPPQARERRNSEPDSSAQVVVAGVADRDSSSSHMELEENKKDTSEVSQVISTGTGTGRPPLPPPQTGQSTRMGKSSKGLFSLFARSKSSYLFSDVTDNDMPLPDLNRGTTN